MGGDTLGNEAVNRYGGPQERCQVSAKPLPEMKTRNFLIPANRKLREQNESSHSNQGQQAKRRKRSDRLDHDRN